MPLVVGPWCAALWLALASTAGGDVIPLAVSNSPCEFVLATPHTSSQFYLIVGSLSGAAKATSVGVRAQAATGPELLPMADRARDPVWKLGIDTQARDLERQRRLRPAPDRFVPVACPPPA